jgi:uncharacterized protein YegJ (DUF2314 family)
MTLLLALSLLAAAAPVQEDRRSAIVDVAADDAEMEAAKRKGRATLPEFYRHLAAPGPDESMFSVKYDLLPGEEAEFIWAKVTARDGATLKGTLSNVPLAPGYRLGQAVTIREADIIDWQYRKGGVVQGHHTTRVLIDRMPAAEAAEYRAALGW